MRLLLACGLLLLLHCRRLHCRCCPAGMSLGNLAKILKCAGNDDIVTMKAADDGDTVTFMFESPSEYSSSSRGQLSLLAHQQQPQQPSCRLPGANRAGSHATKHSQQHVLAVTPGANALLAVLSFPASLNACALCLLLLVLPCRGGPCV